MSALLQFVRSYLERVFYNEEAVFVVIALVGIALLLALFGSVLLPITISAVIAYIMLGVKDRMELFGLKGSVSFILSYAIYLLATLLLGLLLLPRIATELVRLATDVPNFVRYVQQQLLEGEAASYISALPATFKDSMSENLLLSANEAASAVAGYSTTLAQYAITFSLYYVLVPIMVFFFMRDGKTIAGYLVGLLPGKKDLAGDIWRDMDMRLANYVRGKAVEIIIVTLIAWALMFAFDMRFSLLLALATGLSVIVPVVGAFVVTIPVVAFALLDFGFTTSSFLFIGLFLVLQFIDGYVIVPLIFSEAMKIHALVVIVSVLFFGGIWGFWGAFFAIPLATLVKVVFDSWPSGQQPIS